MHAYCLNLPPQWMVCYSKACKGIFVWITWHFVYILYTFCIHIVYIYIFEGSLEVKLPTIWTVEKQRWEEKSQKRQDQKKEDADARKGRKVAKHCVFPMICGSGGSKSRLAKAAGAEPAGQMRDEKLHAVVARSTFPSQNVQNTPASDHFWKLRCRKSARRCGAKHISKSKCTKHTRFGPLLEVEMSKKCTPLWREAHFQVKMYKAHQVRTTFGSWDVEKCTPLWREAHFQVKSVKNWRSRTTFGGSDVEKVSKKCTPLWREAHFEVKSVKNWGFWAFSDVKMSKK